MKLRNKIKRELMNELVYTLKEHCEEEYIPEKLRVAPDVSSVWKAQWADYVLYDIAGELVEDMIRVLQKHALETFIGGEE